MSDPPVELQSPACPVCGGDAHQTVMRGAYDHIWRKPGVFQLQRCEGCQLVTTRPRPGPDDIGFYYEDTYSGEGTDGMRHFQTESALGRLVSWYRLSVIQKVRRLTQSDHLLDVGCSYGGFLRYARERSGGCATSGIDMDEGSIADAVDRDQTDYRTGRLVDAGFTPGTFTVVTFFESLEHHSEPVAALRTAHELLVPGGHVVVEVPNFGGFWRRVFRTAWLPLLIPQHLFHFTPKSLQRTLAAAGFTHVEHHQTMFYPLEGVASLGVWLGRILRSPPMGSPPALRNLLIDLPAFLLLLALYPVLELPSQALLRLTGHAGHQLVVARKE